MNALDISVSFPSAGVIRLRSRSLFVDAESPACRRFLERVFRVEEISGVTIIEGDSAQADLGFRSRNVSLHDVAERVVVALGQGPLSDDGPKERVVQVAPAMVARDDRGTIRYYCYDSLVTGWQIKSDLPGRLRLKNPVLYRKSVLCQAIERELMGVLGVDRFSTNAITCTVLVNYDTNQLTRTQVIEVLDAALIGAEQSSVRDKLDVHLPVCTASIPLAAYSQSL